MSKLLGYLVGAILAFNVFSLSEASPTAKSASDTSNIYLVKNGKPLASIVTAEPRHEYVQGALDLLQKYVHQITGCKLEVISESEAQGRKGPFVFLGMTRAAKEAGLALDQLTLDDFICKVKDQNLYLVGRDDYFKPSPEENHLYGCHGTRNAVFRILHDYAGIRWLMPIPNGTKVPKSPHFFVPAALNEKLSITFGYAMPRLDAYGEWSQAHGFRRALKVKLFGGHSWMKTIMAEGDPTELFKKDPTRFAYFDGKRQLRYDPNDKNTPKHQLGKKIMLCTSHPKYVEMHVNFYSKLFEDGYDWVEFNVNDGFQMCRCAACNAMDETDEYHHYPYWYNADWDKHEYKEGQPAAERIWIPLNEIARQLYKKYPEKKILALMYQPTSIPSKKVRDWSPNVAMSMARQHQSHFDQFKTFKDKAVYLYWWGTYCAENLSPKETARDIAANVKLFKNNGVQGLYLGGGNEQWALEGRAYYTLGALNTHPNKPLDEIVSDFDEGVFGAAAPEMRRFFDLIDERRAVGWRADRIPDSWTPDYRIMPSSSYLPAAYPPEVIRKMEAIIQKALGLVLNDIPARRQIEAANIQVRYFSATAEGFRAYQEYLSSKTDENKERVRAALKFRESIIAEIAEMANKHSDIEDWFPKYKSYLAIARSGAKFTGALSKYHPYKYLGRELKKPGARDWDQEDNSGTEKGEPITSDNPDLQ
jgi:hypothetical protein